MAWLLGLINPVGRIIDALTAAYAVKSDAKTEQQRIAADVHIAGLNAQLEVQKDKQRSPVFWFIWAWFAGVVAIYFTKIVLWDVVFGWGTTASLKGQAAEWAQAVINSIFITGGGVAAVGTVANALSRWGRK
ncbi:MAG: hypothetical protein GXP16_12060 [Gammaproteobacteria bacterium]|nr:hypothetical protein [Gammaproteobacteria bacterium]